MCHCNPCDENEFYSYDTDAKLLGAFVDSLAENNLETIEILFFNKNKGRIFMVFKR